MCFSTQKNRLNKTLLLNTHNIYILVEKKSQLNTLYLEA